MRLPFFYEGLETLFDYIPDGIVTLDNQVFEVSESRWDSIRNQYETRKIVSNQNYKLGAGNNPVNPELLYINNKEFQHWLSNNTPKGGRKGKHSPYQIKIFKKQHQDSIDLSFRENAMNKFYQKALEDKKIQPINKAEITKLQFENESDLEFIAIFEVVPSFKLPNYAKKYKINTTKYIASDKDVTMSLSEMQNNYSTPEEVSGKAKEGFDLIVDYQELNEQGNPIPGRKTENQKLLFSD